MNAKTEAIANADAYLNNAGLPTYSELGAALDRLVAGVGNKHNGACAAIFELNKPCDCVLGAARAVLTQYGDAF
ncbi:hypothetical protein CFB82_20090 [Burkholderia sp. HI2714]|uniref:hypothetical protein n=1 Tax=Burkholderia sp. HI2714 TaxID=2015359 RepID=UPI000B7A1F95|nr:hypothetical protein [Burkholderia sp. HI2714]OXJ32686.1 hypothetical protein CFB82_20090 [Burkholderia sp. HI2714]